MWRNSGFIGAVLAMVLLAVPAVATFLDILNGPDGPREEGVARTPLLDGGLKRFLADARFYIKQRFATKDQMIMLNGVIKTKVFASSPYTNVIEGEGGFLFLTDDEAVSYHQHIDLFTDDELSSWREGLIRTTARLKDLGAHYHVLIAPNKSRLYSAKLPRWLNQHKHPQSRLDQLFAALQDAPVRVTYPLVALQKTIANFPYASPFFKTDTHWNEFGAGVAAEELLEDLNVSIEGVIRPQPYTLDKAGDLARMIGQQHLLVEQSWTLPDAWLSARCVQHDGERFGNHQTDPLKFNRVDCTGGQKNGLKALVFMDSFGVGLVPVLGVAFEEVVFVWRYQLDDALVEQMQPDFVIHQLVERKLQTLEATDLFRGL